MPKTIRLNKYLIHEKSRFLQIYAIYYSKSFYSTKPVAFLAVKFEYTENELFQSNNKN